jgi:hypothetical protein
MDARHDELVAKLTIEWGRVGILEMHEGIGIGWHG